MFELEHMYASQPYLECLNKTIFIVAYYGLFRVGDITKSQHSIKACNVNIANNKDKLLFVLYSSKTHGKESRPQKVKISGTEKYSKVKRFFCPFKLTRKYIAMRGNYIDTNEQFFIFRDRTPVTPLHLRTVLHQTLKRTGINENLYNCQSFRIGRTSDLVKMGYSIEEVKRFGCWKSNAVYKYIKL